ncbi:MAG: ABC transporter permease [Gammaproteobacteria bacterium]|nr:ABC transporter permease [Gammaproteobacteria bacterium]
MLRHYLMMATRGFARHKLYSFINVAGLSVALACAILILLFVRDQLSYDDWIPGTQNLYRLQVTWYEPGGQLLPTALSPFPVLNAMQAEVPGVAAVTHVVPEQMTVKAGDLQFLQTVTVVDPSFFRVIRLPLVSGDPATALAEPESIVLSQSMARKYFGRSNPVGRFLQVSGVAPFQCKPNDSACFSATHTLRVTGVLRDLPHNTQLIADFVMPNTSQADELTPVEKETGWTGTFGNISYVRLAPGTSQEKVLAGVRSILDRAVKAGPDLKGSDLEHYSLTPFRSVHLTSGNFGEMRPTVSRTTVDGFALIAFLIVLVAACNFMNLATARATLRAREVGLRKVVGAKRRQLAVQFLVEAVCTTLLSLAIALSLVEVLLPFYDRFLGEPIGLHYSSDGTMFGTTIAGAVLLGLLSGAYPAMVLCGFRPIATLKLSGGALGGSGLLRSLLVIGQFVVSIGLGIAAIVFFRQIHFARTLDLGFNRYGMVVVQSTSNISADARVRLARVLSAGPGIVGAALSNVVPFDTGWAFNETVRTQGGIDGTTAHVVMISPEFPALYGMRLLAGRFLSADHGQDTQADLNGKNVLINAEAARRFGFKSDAAVGKEIDLGSSHLRVVGVLNDSMKEGLRSAVWPVVYMVDTDNCNLLSVRVRADRLPEALAFIDRTWRSFAPAAAMQRYFMSDAFDDLFTADERQGTMFVVFVTIAVLIACLGLFGLVVFTAERRTKEVGIRKISGACTADIVRLMLWRISVPVLSANLIAWPLAYLYLHRWLEGYTDRITLSPLYFLGTGAAALLIAWATVYANTLRLARASPVHALRYE